MTEAQQRAYDQAQVMLAFSQGKKVEGKQKMEDQWIPIDGPFWDFFRYDYRIAPEPQEVWLWVKEGQYPVLPCYWAQGPKAISDMGYTKKLFREVLP